MLVLHEIVTQHEVRVVNGRNGKRVSEREDKVGGEDKQTETISGWL
jgi:hypothetical protein